MKYKIIFALIILSAISIAARERIMRQRYRAALLDLHMQSQISAIQERARHFMEFKTGNHYITGSLKVEACKLYEVSIGVPPDHTSEFLNWMRGTSLNSVKIGNWPSTSGTSNTTTTNTLTYRVYYGQSPKDWE